MAERFLSVAVTVSPGLAVPEASTTSLVVPPDGGLKGAGPEVPSAPARSHGFGGEPAMARSSSPPPPPGSQVKRPSLSLSLSLSLSALPARRARVRVSRAEHPPSLALSLPASIPGELPARGIGHRAPLFVRARPRGHRPCRACAVCAARPRCPATQPLGPASQHACPSRAAQIAAPPVASRARVLWWPTA